MNAVLLVLNKGSLFIIIDTQRTALKRTKLINKVRYGLVLLSAC